MNLTSGVEEVPIALFWGVAATGLGAGAVVFSRSRALAAMGSGEASRLADRRRVMHILTRLDDVQDVALSYVSRDADAGGVDSFGYDAFEEMIKAHSHGAITSEETRILFDYFDRRGDNQLCRQDIAHFCVTTYWHQSEGA
jgi:hypothetical protein